MSTSSKSLSFDACGQFLGISELVNIFLEQCSTNVLLNCTMVCRTWNKIINQSPTLQQNLFFEPITAGNTEEYSLNPVLSSHFAPVLCPELLNRDLSTLLAIKQLEAGHRCLPEDLPAVSWARNTSMHAHIDNAMIRQGASWRNMLVSQPPIKRIDWWHEWIHDRSATDNTGSWSSSRIFDLDPTAAQGWGHEDQNREYVTLGMLWDLVESRVTRGCAVRVQYFPHGKAVEEDEHATVEERSFIQEGHPGRRLYTSTTPRVKITTQQIWGRIPWARAGFDMIGKQWLTMTTDRPFDHTGDGFSVLRSDCQYDLSYKTKPPKGTRWSKSKEFRWNCLDGESHGRQGGLEF
jgi:hypothetical protein